MERRCWVNFQCRGVQLIWIIVGKGPTVLAAGAGGVLSSIISLFFFLSMEDGPIYAEILSQRAIKPKTTNHTLWRKGENIEASKEHFLLDDSSWINNTMYNPGK